MTAKPALFRWRGLDAKGHPRHGKIEAATEAEARLLLVRQGISARQLRPGRPGRGPMPGSIPGFGNRSKIRSSDLMVFTRQTASMLKSGIPLTQSLEVVAGSLENTTMLQLVNAIRSRVTEGSSLKEALSEHPRQFDALYLSMIDIGDTTGTLDLTLDRIACWQERRAAVAARIKKAMLYPVLVLLTALLITVVMLVKVVPAFADTFADLGAELPGFTRWIMKMSDMLISSGLPVTLAVLLAVAAGSALVKSRDGLRYMCARLVLRLPVIGDLQRDAAVARICRTLATTLSAGLPMLQALKLSTSAAGNIVFRRACLAALADINQGQTLGFSIRNTGLFPVMITQLTKAGEESGTLDIMLERCASHFESRIDQQVDTLTSMLEPLIMIVLGVLVGGLMIAMYLPVFRLGAAL